MLMFLSVSLRSAAFSPVNKSLFIKTSPKRTLSAFAVSATTNMPQYWNREESTRKAFAAQKPICKEAKIISLSDANDPANFPLHKGELPEGASLLAIGSSVEEFDIAKLEEEKPNVLFVSHPLVS